MAKQILPDNLIANIKAVGAGTFTAWLAENEFTLPKAENLFESLELAFEDGTMQISDILSGISELEENSDKNIFLFQTKSLKKLITDQKEILKEIKKEYGYAPSTDATIRVTPGDGPTFVYMTVDQDEIKMKFAETHYDKEDDLANDRYIRVPRIVNVFFIVELKSGFAQIRFDAPGQIHTHRNDQSKSSEVVYQNYYKDLFVKLFPTVPFEQFSLTGVANYIRLKEKERFLMQKLVSTVSEGVKQTHSNPRKKDVRFIKELIGAAATDDKNEWLTEDISGYWLASHSQGQLKRDLFMRIYRRDSEIRVLRGCLKKELDYGISQIREIQASI